MISIKNVLLIYLLFVLLLFHLDVLLLINPRILHRKLPANIVPEVTKLFLLILILHVMPKVVESVLRRVNHGLGYAGF